MRSTELLDRRAAPAADAVRAALAELTHAVDVLQAQSLDGLDDHEMLAVFRDLETQRRRMPTVDHRLITELECSTAVKLLVRGTPGLLTELLHVDVAEAKARVRAAAVLGPRTGLTGQPLEPVYAPAAEQTLVEQATGLRPSELSKVADRLTAYLDPDGQLSDDSDRAARRALKIGRQRPDGMSAITGLLDPATRALVDVAFSALARPTPDGDTPDPRSPAQRNHDALAALCRNALASDTLPSNRGLSAIVVLNMDIDQLEAAAGVATTATGGTVPIRDALAMATDVYPVLCLFDRNGQPLHLGRGARLASAAQRLALYARDRGCTLPGCDMPAQWCQVHHLDEYQYGGRTDVNKMCLVCPFDHPLITEYGFTVRMGPNGRAEWIAPKHLDPAQTPRINSIHHPPDLTDPDPP